MYSVRLTAKGLKPMSMGSLWVQVGLVGHHSSGFGDASVPLTVVPVLMTPGIEKFPAGVVRLAEGAAEAAGRPEETGVPRTVKGSKRKDGSRYFMALL